jgi:hypothetical protein
VTAPAFVSAGERYVEREPLLLFDDMQWCDRDTPEWLHFLLRSIQTAGLEGGEPKPGH